MSQVMFHSIWTVLLLILFVGIIVWAFSSRRKRAFDEAARLPLEDEDTHLLPPSQRLPTRASARFGSPPSPSGRRGGDEGGSRRGARSEEKKHV